MKAIAKTFLAAGDVVLDRHGAFLFRCSWSSITGLFRGQSFSGGGLGCPDQQPPPQSIGSSPEYDAWWKQLQDQQFAGGTPPTPT